jgi:GT2 family glycosyltransferase
MGYVMSDSIEFGFNVISYVSGNLGIGVTARNVVRVLLERGCPVSILDLDPGQGRKGFDSSFEEYYVNSIQEMPYGLNLLVLPPAGIKDILPSVMAYKPNCLNVGFCMWELPILPKSCIAPMQALDVLVAQTQFIRYAFDFNLSGVTTISAVHPIYLPEGIEADRTCFGLPENAIIFFTGFEPYSDPQRKNPFATIRSFIEELGQDERAHLVIKLNNAVKDGVLHPIAVELKALCSGNPRIHFMTENLTYHEVLQLYASCDVYVSLHRAEGLGLGPMEAMALGKPVISTGWSGNMTYMDHTNSCLVGYDLIPVDGSISHYSREVLGQDTVWADARVPEASTWMRRLVDDPELRRSIGEKAANAMRAHHALACRGDFIDELKSIWDHHSYINAPVTTPQGPARQDVRVLRDDKLRDFRIHVAEQVWAENYQRWMEKHELRQADVEIYAERLNSAGSSSPIMHLLVTASAGMDALLADTLDSIGAQIYANWRLTIVTDMQLPEGALDPSDRIQWRAAASDREFMGLLNEAAQSVPADWVVRIEAGDRLAPQALAACACYIGKEDQWRLIYTDEDLITKEGKRYDPSFKPDFNLDLLRSTPYTGTFLPVRRDAFLETGGFEAVHGVEGYDLVFKCIERNGEGAIGHIHDVLIHRLNWNHERYRTEAVEENGRQVVERHLARTGIQANVSKGLLPHSYFVEYLHSDAPLVTIIIPTRDRLDLLRPCVESVLGKTTYRNYEIVVIDNDSRDPATLGYLDKLPGLDARVRVIRYPHPYNYSSMNNIAAREARGDYLLLLNNDTVVIQPQWLERMMMCAQREDVGIVGARLVYPNKTVQHVGLIAGMGVHGVCEHVNIGTSMTAPGYLGRSQLTQELSVVTAACMLVKKSVYDEVHGLDESSFKVLFNDVDFCLRVRERGWKVVWTPFATILHHGSISLKSFTDTQDEMRGRRELEVMRERWLPALANDPSFNRNLSLLHRHVTVDVDIDARWDPNFHDRSRILSLGIGSYGSWQYRAVQPLSILHDRALAQTAFCEFPGRRVRIPTVSELARLAPDTLLMHNALHDAHLNTIEDYKKHAGAFIVFGQDDLMYALPAKNQFRKRVYKDMKKRLRKALQSCDRLVVTTEPLAQALSDMIGDVRIVPNYLDGNIWCDLQPLRRQGRRPRVGWAGATQHQGDLEILIDVVKATSDEVDWVFFGMCPEAIRPLIAEFHNPVSFEQYPARLAGLNLDLALAPLEHNNFNEAKSNLRILEYGVLGWPVIASDIHPYQSAPVFRVPNNASAWIRAIREHVSDLDALAREGDKLRAWVHADWMLEDNLDAWLDALSPGGGAARSAVHTGAG